MPVAKTAAKIVISAGLLMFLVWSVDAEMLLRLLSSANPIAILCAALGLFALTPLLALRWQTVIAALRLQVGYGDALRMVLVGMFFNQLLPSAIGGDAYRAWALRRRGIPLSHGLNSVVLDRATALVATLGVTLAGLAEIHAIVPAGILRSSIHTFLAVTVLGAMTGLALTVFADRLPMDGLLGRFAAFRFVKKAGVDVLLLLRNPRASLVAMALSVFLNVAVSLAVWLIAMAAGENPTMVGCIFVVPLVMLVSMIPISVAGWGVREGSMVFGLGLLGVQPPAALAISVLYGVALIAVGVPGGFVWLFSRHRGLVSNPGK